MTLDQSADNSTQPVPDPCDENNGETPSHAPKPSVDERFAEIASQLKRGLQPPKQTVRILLEWIGVTRRGFNVNLELRTKLSAAKLKTEPDFEYAYIDDNVGFVPATTSIDAPGGDPSYRIGQLEAANRKPTTLNVDNTLEEAISVMLKHNFSQIPVMANQRDVSGVVSWKSIGVRMALRVPCKSVREYMEAPQIVSAEDSFFSALQIISRYDYVLVKGKDRTVTGIITASDFNDQFRKMAEPFLLVGEIENGIRGILRGKYTDQQLQAAKAPPDERRLTGIDKLNFGEYARLLGNEQNWMALGLHVDRAKFVCWLTEVGKLRNNVMHFNPDGLAKVDLAQLQEFAEFLKCLRDAGALKV